MAALTKHPRTGTYRIRLAIPAHLQATTARLYGRKVELIEDLGTKEPATARKLAAAAIGRLQALIEIARCDFNGEAVPVSERDIQAMAGVFYARQVEAFDDDPGSRDGWSAELDQLDDQRDPDPEGPLSAWPCS